MSSTMRALRSSSSQVVVASTCALGHIYDSASVLGARRTATMHIYVCAPAIVIYIYIYICIYIYIYHACANVIYIYIYIYIYI